MSTKEIVAYTAICEEDAGWIDQYLDEVRRLNINFVIHFDRCSKHTIKRLAWHDKCLGSTQQDNPEIEFTEQHKQEVFNLIASMCNVNWALAWDIDETWEYDAYEKLQQVALCGDYDYIDCPWFNLWGDRRHIRVDRGFCTGHRVKLHNLRSGYKWIFNHPITNGPTGVPIPDLAEIPPVMGSANIVCLHHGMMTPELRRFHKERWDRIYSTALKGDANPYGFWREAIETEDSAVLLKHGYFHA